MARTKIKDLPREQKINREEIRKVIGGVTLDSHPIVITNIYGEAQGLAGIVRRGGDAVKAAMGMISGTSEELKLQCTFIPGR